VGCEGARGVIFPPNDLGNAKLFLHDQDGAVCYVRNEACWYYRDRDGEWQRDRDGEMLRRGLRLEKLIRAKAVTKTDHARADAAGNVTKLNAMLKIASALACVIRVEELP
jgi:hypothetical protein